MDGLKVFSFFLASFVFVVAIALAGQTLTFYFKNQEMFQNPKEYSKKYVLIDSTYNRRVGSKNPRYLTYGLSKTFDNYKTTFDLNLPDGSALIENDIIVERIQNPLNESIIHYYAWVNKQKKIGYIANEYEESIQDNWIFLDQILYIKLNIGMFIFSIVVFIWLKVYKVFQK